MLSSVFCALHDQLASLGRHAQLTCCFSVVAELLFNFPLATIPSIIILATSEIEGVSGCAAAVKNPLSLSGCSVDVGLAAVFPDTPLPEA